ncbi:MAG: hypothetical protein U9Q15_05525, partial [Patescibacteria group bacterium]|nr:hypothetical protein [Patescibacteria group bacterium]
MVIISIVATMGLAIYRRYKKTYIRLYKNKECIYIDGFSLSENEAKDQQNKVGSPEPSSEAIDTYLVRGRNIEHRGMGELFSFIEKDI